MAGTKGLEMERRYAYGVVLLILVVTIGSVSALATTRYWDVSSGNWNVSGNWDPSGIPDSDDETKVRRANSTCTVPNGYSATCYRLYVYSSDTTGATCTFNIAAGASLATNNYFFKTGFDDRDGVTNQAGDVDLGTSGDLLVGDGSSSYDSGTNGYYYHTGGTTTADDCFIGYRGGNGWLYQSGGLAQFDDLHMAYNGGDSDGVYELSGGTLEIGDDAFIGETSNANGTFKMTGGKLDIDGTLYVGHNGIGVVELAGGDADLGVVTVNDHLTVGKGCDYDAVGNMSFASASELSVDIEGSSAGEHTLLEVDGNVTITSGATLESVYLGDYTPQSGTEITIIKVTGGHSISGTFTNHPTGWTTVLKNSNTELAARRTQDTPIPAFPGAEGEGKWATGGRGGDVYHVTNTNDSGAGSLRYGVENATGPRTIVFDTGGTIHLTSGDIVIRSGDMTIAGETAPGDGICISGYCLHVYSDNIIIRHMRLRPGDIEGPDFFTDALNIHKAEDVIVDHCSTSWGIDEVLSVFGDCDDVTVQWCIISEGLHCTGYHEYGPDVCHSAGSLVRCYDQDCHVTFHHNIYAHNDERNPRLGSYDNVTLWCDFRNNLIYNWGSNEAGSGCVQGSSQGERCNLNYVGNYIVKGPDTEGNTAFRGYDSSYMDIYQSGNKIDLDRDTNKDGSNTGWSMFSGDYDDKASPFSMEAVTTQSADDAADDVRDYAGATVPSRDAVDARVIADIWDDDGDIIDSQDDVGGWPSYSAGTAPTDTDGDGMPDSWENSYGTNPNVADNNGDLDSDGYTNLEEYLHSLCD